MFMIYSNILNVPLFYGHIAKCVGGGAKNILFFFFEGGARMGVGGNENFTALHTQKQTAIEIRLIKTAIAK